MMVPPFGVFLKTLLLPPSIMVTSYKAHAQPSFYFRITVATRYYKGVWVLEVGFDLYKT